MKIDISSIISKFAGFDKAGENSNKIDTYLEYYKLGGYLNGKLHHSEFGDFSKLNRMQRKKILNIYQEVQKDFNERRAQNDDCIQITDGNAEEYAEIYRELDYNADATKLEECDLLAKALYEYCKNSGYDMQGRGYNQCNYRFIVSRIKSRNEKEAVMQERGQVVVDRIKNPYDKGLLEKAAEKRILDENIQELDKNKYTIDIGNGQYDKSATQKTELCWAHAGIKSLGLSEEGRTLLDSNKYYDPKTGVFAIHLQEAEDYGLHGGIYVITPDEIEAEGKNLSEGEGDVTVWMIALKRYFEEMEQSPELMQKAAENQQLIQNVDSGNAQFRFFEIITGAQPSRKNSMDETRLQVGVTYGKNDITFEDISDLVSNQKGAAVICIGGHAMSVVGVRDDKLLIQESNNSLTLGDDFYDSKRNHVLFVKTDDINGNPTYELTEDDFEHYNFGEGVIKWK